MLPFAPFSLPVVGMVAGAKMAGAVIDFWSRPLEIATGFYGLAAFEMAMTFFKKNEEKGDGSSNAFSAF